MLTAMLAGALRTLCHQPSGMKSASPGCTRDCKTHQSCRSAGSREAQTALQPPKGILSRSLAAKVQRPKNTSMSGLLLSKVSVSIKQLIAAGDARCGASLRAQFARKSGPRFGNAMVNAERHCSYQAACTLQTCMLLGEGQARHVTPVPSRSS